MSASQYARLVPKKYRHRTLPKIDRPWRPRVIAWAGPSAFYPNRFYEIDKWYKSRIDKPEKLPNMHIIDPTDHMRSLQELLAKPEIHMINIGYKKQESVAKKTEIDKAKLERKSRNLELIIETDELCFRNVDICKHFAIFDHLFGDNTFFENVQNMEINYDDNIVYNGNILSASSVQSTPRISIESIGEGGFNSLLMVNLDGNAFENRNGEVIHWFVGNIPNGEEVSNGDQILEYIQPIPFYGTGYHRIAFVLFRHSEKIDFSDFSPKSTLEDRIHDISQFYKKYENMFTPSAIRFFQTSYDDSVKYCLHKMNLKSPLYEYQYRPALKPKQREFPEKMQPFDLYLDAFRDPKEVEAELLEKRLENAQLDDYEVPKWRDINYNENKKKLPSWLHSKMIDRDGPAKAVHVNKL